MPSQANANSVTESSQNTATIEAATSSLGDVLTLSETAAFLRVSEDDVLRMMTSQSLPGRRIGENWRFLKGALKKWLSSPLGKKGILDHIGAISDDPYVEEMLAEIYQRRKSSNARAE